jgi:hypothetical protein
MSRWLRRWNWGRLSDRGSGPVLWPKMPATVQCPLRADHVPHLTGPGRPFRANCGHDEVVRLSREP